MGTYVESFSLGNKPPTIKVQITPTKQLTNEISNHTNKTQSQQMKGQITPTALFLITTSGRTHVLKVHIAPTKKINHPQ